MQIAYISDERYPSTHTDTQQVVMTSRALLEAGASLYLIVPAWLDDVPMPGHESGKLDNISQSEAIQRYYGIRGPIPVVALRTASPNRRAIVKALHAVAAQRVIQTLQPDVVYTRNPPTAIAAVLRGFPVVLESYRIIDRKFRLLAHIWSLVARSPNFLGVICHSQMSADSFVRSGVPDANVLVVHNGFDPETMLPRMSKEDARRDLRLPSSEFLACYSGHLNPNKGVDTLAQWAAATPEIRHIWVGGGNQGSTDYARSEMAKANAHNVELAGWVPPARLPPYLYAADVLLIPPTAGPLASHGSTVLPMKTFAYMAAGRAIVAPNLPDIREVLRHEENALLVEPDRLELAKQALDLLRHNPDLLAKLGRAAQRDSNQFSWHGRAKKILQFLEKRLSAVRNGRKGKGSETRKI